jgi:hypothetical protein
MLKVSDVVVAQHCFSGGCGVFDADLEVKCGCVEVVREAMK